MGTINIMGELRAIRIGTQILSAKSDKPASSDAVQPQPIDIADGTRLADRPPAGQSSRNRWLLFATLIALVAAMAAQFLARRQELGQFFRLSTATLLLLLILQVVSQLVWNAATLVPLRVHVRTLGFWELFMLRMGGLIVGNFVPVAGNFAVRMAYLKRQGVAYADFTWATVLVNLVGLIVGAVIALFGLVALVTVVGAASLAILLLTAGVLAASIAVLATTRALPRLVAHPSLRRWSALASGLSFSASRRTVSWISAFSLVRHLMNFLVLGLLYETLSGAPGGLLTGGLVYAVTSPIRTVAITPGDNLGLNEWLIASVGRALSFDVTTGLIAALVYRGVSIASQGVCVLAGSVWLAVGPRRDALPRPVDHEGE